MSSIEQVEKEFKEKYETDFFTDSHYNDMEWWHECVPLTKEQSVEITAIANDAHNYYNPTMKIPIEQFSREEPLLIIEKLHAGIDKITHITMNEG